MTDRVLPAVDRRAWMALAGLCITGFFTFGVGVYAFTQFQVPLSQALHLGRGFAGGLLSAFWLAAPFVLISAVLLDRVGGARLILIGGLVEAAAMMLVALAPNELSLYALRFLMGVGKALAVTPIPILVVRWFPRRTSMIVGIAISSWHLGGILLAPAAAALIGLVGWRGAAAVIGFVLAIGIGLAAVLIARSGLEDRAPAPDTAPSAPAAAPRRVAAPLVFGIVIGTIGFYAGYSALLAQLSPLLTDVGYHAQQVGAAMGTVAFSAFVGVLVFGVVADVTRSDVAGAGFLLATALLAVIATSLSPLSGIAPVYALVVGVGVLIGGGDPVMVEALRRVAGHANFHRAYGWWYLLVLATLSVVSVTAGVIFDLFGSYRGAFYGIAGLATLAAAAWVLTIRPGRLALGPGDAERRAA